MYRDIRLNPNRHAQNINAKPQKQKLPHTF